MLGDRSLFCHFEEIHKGSVTFGDGNLAKIIGKVTIEELGFPKLENILYVEGLKHNLLSISQNFDISYSINFAKDCYEIKDNEKVII